MIIQPTQQKCGDLWGECLIAADPTLDLPSRPGTEAFIGPRGPIEISQVGFKPYAFENYRSGAASIEWCMKADYPLTYTGPDGPPQHPVSLWQMCANAHRLGVKLDVMWDGHWDLPGGLAEYHKRPETAPPWMRRHLFPFSAREREENVTLLVAVLEYVQSTWPGLVGRVSCSNEPYYCPKWVAPHTPMLYAAWVEMVYSALNALPFDFELAAAAGKHGTTGNQPFQREWQRTLYREVVTEVHFLQPVVVNELTEGR